MNEGHWNFKDPINQRNFPKQYRDYMNIAAERRKANSLKLKPVKRPKATSQVVIEPSQGIGRAMQLEQIFNNRARGYGERV